MFCLSPRVVLLRLPSAFDIRRALGVHEEGDNQAVETQDFGENENQDHADEQSWLLSCAADTCIADDTDCEARLRYLAICSSRGLNPGLHTQQQDQPDRH